VAVGDQTCKAIKKPFTFQVWLRILVMCSFLENLKRKVFGPRTAKENGLAKNYALIRLAFIDWLF
jgi:hypothetical protein